ncbi:DNA cytosine methyltransferase [uncultured Treponema sp.]|uniref:DNA cytosine methyltransferase n=1 Tax=uncultured Treponema sp. TaxID=162155 RepID=UPI0025D126AB|nr:DNA cytosine methyltransferase [uncultured Treponema sp.]
MRAEKINGKKLTYISLFSSAGVGCYGFKMAGYNCIATNELIPRRLEIQKFNNKCKYESGYICGDIKDESTKAALFSQIDLWKQKEDLKRVDVLIATPPCQGMSVANHKKAENEIIRNSLVVESIKIIKEVNPKFFIFENVPAFMKTACTDIDGQEKPISQAIESNLGERYSYISRVINFKDYGACSSRQRTLVIGVSREFSDEISPIELFPSIEEEKTLRQVIGNLKSLSFGEIGKDDFYHAFRTYPEHMRTWIHDLKEGESAFDNKDIEKIPHQVKNGQIVINKRKNADKYTRQYWDKVAPCVHTRNDQLASQNTIHPQDDRVFSIRELMRMMTIPDSFKWIDKSLDELNDLPEKEKSKLLKKEAVKIRQSIGEAVPTKIFNKIAENIKQAVSYEIKTVAEINKIISKFELTQKKNLVSFINENPLNISVSALGRIAELCNSKRVENAAYFTNKSLITEIVKNIPDIEKKELNILEPSVGVGNFIPLILRKFENKKINLDVIDINADSLEIAKLLISKINIPDGFRINYINADFLLYNVNKKYDFVIGNPPFQKSNIESNLLKAYKKNVINDETNNLCSFFLEKSISISDYVAMVFPKFLLNTPEFSKSRNFLSKKAVDCIVDFGEKGFKGVLVETLAIFINNNALPDKTKVISITKHLEISQKQDYIFDEKLPYWIIYRNDFFDKVLKKLDFGEFSVFRDRQITNAKLNSSNGIRVLKSRNIDDSGTSILTLPDYDSYIMPNEAKELSVFKYLNSENIFLTPNMTYKPRMMRKPKNCLVNGSVAILFPKKNLNVSDKQLAYFSTDEYRAFYQIARNYQTRSLNVDSNSVYFYGLLRNETGEE